MLEFDAESCLAEIRKAPTVDLVDRVTAYRQGMEPRAVGMIERELSERGVSQDQIDACAVECDRDCVFDADGTALRCSRCRRPAVSDVWRWHRLWGVVPLFPRRLLLCKDHAPIAG